MSTAASPQFSDAIVVMGVTGCGKTTVGEALAAHFKVAFTEGDKLHSPANIAKMSSGTPLTDEDRSPWLATIGEKLRGTEGHVASCSALKKAYREAIATAAQRPVIFVHLHGSRAVLQARANARKGHFMPPSLLDSQLATLETPTDDETAITIDIDQSPESIVSVAVRFVTGKSD